MSPKDLAAPRSSADTSVAPRRRRRGRRRSLPPVVVGVGWVTVIPLVVLAALRVFAWDVWGPLIIVNTVTAFVYLPAWIVALIAAIGRKFVLTLAATLVVGAQVAFMAPELLAATGPPPWAHRAPKYKLFDANVYEANPTMAGYSRLIRAVNPDLLTLEEATPSDLVQLKADGALVHLPYEAVVPRYDAFGFIVASHFPLSGLRVLYLRWISFLLETTVHLPSGPVTLWVVHTVAPVPASWRDWSSELDRIVDALRRRPPGPLLLEGDFNATWGNKGFRQILGTGLVDGAAARGEPFAMTWSQTAPVVPPLVRIDHVLTSSGLAVTQIATGEGPGSDHRAIMATVATATRSR